MTEYMEDQQSNSCMFTNFAPKNWRFHGVEATMCGIRERFWTPKSRNVVKRNIYNCNLCKIYRKESQKPPATWNLPRFLSEMGEPLQTTGTNYTAIFTFATTRSVHLKLFKSILTEELKYTLKEFIVRRRAPRTIISDNARPVRLLRIGLRRSFMMRISSTFSIYIKWNLSMDWIEI